MIQAVKSFDPVVAAGLLARAALSVGYIDDPAGGTTEAEQNLIARVIEEACTRLGLSIDDKDPDSFEKIADLLDAEAEKLAAPRNTESALFRLAERGDLPSDLYEINIVPNVVDVYRKGFSLEKDIIETTVRSPTLEQHYGPIRKPNEPVMISLFLKSFRTPWPLKNFWMIVAAQRVGLRLDVHQAWRIYPSAVKLDGAKTPIDWLRSFADAYGFEIELDGKKGHFFLLARGPIPDTFSFKQPIAKKKTATQELKAQISRFADRDPITQIETAALLVAIDVEKYLRTIKEKRVRRSDILERFVPKPRPSRLSARAPVGYP
jgi:hypothetical protein